MRVIALIAFLASITSVTADGETRQAPIRKGKAPIISTDLIYGTGALLQDVYGAVWDRALKVHYNRVVHPHLSKLGSPTDVLIHVGAKAKIPKEKVLEHVTKGSEAMLHAKALVAEKTAPITGMAYGTATNFAVLAIEKFEQFMPEYEGFIPKTLGDFGLVVGYFAIVLYVMFRVAIGALRFALRSVCFFLCCPCRLCKRGNSSQKAQKVSKGKAAATPAKAKSEPKKKK